MRNINKSVTWTINILLTQGLYSKKKPCHEREIPRDHQGSLVISEGCSCGCHSSEARYECYNCDWGFDAEDLVKVLPIDHSLFE